MSTPQKVKELPKDLGVKLGTPEQVVWEQVLKQSKMTIEECKNNLMIQQGVKELAESKIAIEQSKSKS